MVEDKRLTQGVLSIKQAKFEKKNLGGGNIIGVEMGKTGINFATSKQI